MQIKSAMLRDIYKMAEEKAKATKQPMSQADKERSLGLVHGTTKVLERNPEITNTPNIAAAVASGYQIPNLVSDRPVYNDAVASNYPKWPQDHNEYSTSELPIAVQAAHNRFDMDSDYPKRDPENYTKAFSNVLWGIEGLSPSFKQRVQALRQQALRDGTGE